MFKMRKVIVFVMLVLPVGLIAQIVNKADNALIQNLKELSQYSINLD